MKLLNKIYKTLHELEEVNWESEANCLYYIVRFEEEYNTVQLIQVEDYHFDGDNWGEIDVKSNKSVIVTFEATMSEYLDAVVHYANIMAQDIGNQIMEYEYPYVGHSITFMNGDYE